MRDGVDNGKIAHIVPVEAQLWHAALVGVNQQSIRYEQRAYTTSESAEDAATRPSRYERANREITYSTRVLISEQSEVKRNIGAGRPPGWQLSSRQRAITGYSRWIKG